MISVCMASYNGEQFIGEQLNSILTQLDAADEVIVSDDGSTDDTIGIVKGFEDPRVKLVRNTGQKGVVANIENALVRAKGDLIFLSDQDDIWEKNKIRVMTGYLENYDLVVSDCRIVDQENREIYPSYYASRNSGKGLFRNLMRNSYMGCCMAFTRDLLIKILPFPKHLPMHDWWIGLVAETCFSRFFCPERLVRYRRHADNQTPLASDRRSSLGEQMAWRVNLCTALMRLPMKRLNQ